MDPKPRATVRVVDGQMILDDPDALAMANAVAKANCRVTLCMNVDRVTHFVRRIDERGLAPDDAVIVILNVNDPYGEVLADALMPGQHWDEFRERGEIPFARGLAARAGIQHVLDSCEPVAAAKLRGYTGQKAVVVMDHGTADVFLVSEAVTQ